MRRTTLASVLSVMAFSWGCAPPAAPPRAAVGLPAPLAVGLRFSPLLAPPARAPVPELLAGPAPAPAPAELPPEAPPEPVGPLSGALASGFHNPMPGGVMAGYQADTGLDIAGSPRPVFALASGTLDYSEPGHTLWTGASDTANCVGCRHRFASVSAAEFC